MSLDLPDWSIAQWEELIGWIDDYCTRFIVTCPEDDMNSVMRALEKTREAFWLFADDTVPYLLQQKGMDFTFISKKMHIFFFLSLSQFRVFPSDRLTPFYQPVLSTSRLERAFLSSPRTRRCRISPSLSG